MLFPTVEFALFFVIVFVVAWTISDRPALWRRWLLAASALFYASWNWRYVPLLVALALCNFIAGREIQRASTLALARRWLALAVCLDLGALVLFKYLGFFMATIVDAASLLSVTLRLRPVQLTLPLGISFVTFQSMSFAIDAYRSRTARGHASIQRERASDLLLYVSFFPHLVAGPIVRAQEFLSQIRVIAVPSRDERAAAIVLIGGGLAKKVVLATFLARAIVDPVFAAPEASSAAEILAAIYGYAVQIYADFSGYTDMAIGLAALLGVKFPQNFRQPYRASSLRDFWRRWHITLSRWLRDYLFVSLGGSRTTRLRTLRNLFLTMLLGGLWHGAAWTFVAWGCLHGAGLAIERLFRPDDSDSAPTSRAREALATVCTFHFVCAGWVLFRATSLRDAWTLFARLFGGATGGAPVGSLSPWVVAAIVAGLALHFVPESWHRSLSSRVANTRPALVGLACAALLASLDLLSPPGIAPFIYFQF